MPTYPKFLGQGEIAATAEALYTHDSNYRVTTIKKINLHNPTGTAATYVLHRVPSGGSADTTNQIAEASLAADARVTLELDLTFGASGDALYAVSDTADAVVYTLEGEVNR